MSAPIPNIPRRQGFDTGGCGPYYARAMGNPLQDRCVVAELASARQVIEIAEEISSFEGLAEIVAADLAALDAEKVPTDWRKKAVRGRIEFGFVDAEGRIPMVSGAASVDVDSVCQRCLEAFQQPLSIETKLLLLTADEIVEGYDGFEVWELEEQRIRPQDIVEELLIMAMPFSATHDNLAECRAFTSDGEGAEELVRPFAALRLQMAQNKTDPEN